ncbi:MAG: carbon-nitrogen hydrolase family protein [Candidatus Aenigmarchaeota archaeon]|nr:carbon-nitrogen hydrolase family protein [Candidatus Aenigmarchaeota archaeon]
MFRVSAVQMAIDDKQPGRNLHKILQYMEAAKENGSYIACFPETSLSGLARPAIKEVVDMLSLIEKKAHSLGMYTIVGSYCEKEGKVYNELYVIDDLGTWTRTYQKRHLWEAEEGVMPGLDINQPIITPEGSIGIINCWDIAFPEETKSLAREGARVIFCPAYWFDKPRPDNPDYFGYPSARANENQVYLVFCDAFSKETVGRSKIVSPVKVLAEAREEELISADVDFDELETLRQKYNCWK